MFYFENLYWGNLNRAGITQFKTFQEPSADVVFKDPVASTENIWDNINKDLIENAELIYFGFYFDFFVGIDKLTENIFKRKYKSMQSNSITGKINDLYLKIIKKLNSMEINFTQDDKFKNVNEAEEFFEYFSNNVDNLKYNISALQYAYKMFEYIINNYFRDAQIPSSVFTDESYFLDQLSVHNRDLYTSCMMHRIIKGGNLTLIRKIILSQKRAMKKFEVELLEYILFLLESHIQFFCEKCCKNLQDIFYVKNYFIILKEHFDANNYRDEDPVVEAIQNNKSELYLFSPFIINYLNSGNILQPIINCINYSESDFDDENFKQLLQMINTLKEISFRNSFYFFDKYDLLESYFNYLIVFNNFKRMKVFYNYNKFPKNKFILMPDSKTLNDYLVDFYLELFNKFTKKHRLKTDDLFCRDARKSNLKRCIFNFRDFLYPEKFNITLEDILKHKLKDLDALESMIKEFKEYLGKYSETIKEMKKNFGEIYGSDSFPQRQQKSFALSNYIQINYFDMIEIPKSTIKQLLIYKINSYNITEEKTVNQEITKLTSAFNSGLNENLTGIRHFYNDVTNVDFDKKYLEEQLSDDYNSKYKFDENH